MFREKEEAPNLGWLKPVIDGVVNACWLYATWGAGLFFPLDTDYLAKEDDAGTTHQMYMRSTMKMD